MVQSQTLMGESGFKHKLPHVCLLNRLKKFQYFWEDTRNFATEILKVYHIQQPFRLVALQVIKVKIVNVLRELGI